MREIQIALVSQDGTRILESTDDEVDNRSIESMVPSFQSETGHFRTGDWPVLDRSPKSDWPVRTGGLADWNGLETLFRPAGLATCRIILRRLKLDSVGLTRAGHA